MPHASIAHTLRVLADNSPPLTHQQHADLIGVSVDVYRSWIRLASPVVVNLSSDRDFYSHPRGVIVHALICCRIADVYSRIPCMRTLRCHHIRLSCGVLPHGLESWCRGNFGRSEYLNQRLICPSDSQCPTPFRCNGDSDPAVDILAILAGEDKTPF